MVKRKEVEQIYDGKNKKLKEQVQRRQCRHREHIRNDEQSVLREQNRIKQRGYNRLGKEQEQEV